MSFLLSRFGWARLARAYAAREPRPDGITFRGRSGRIGRFMGYNNCLSVTLARMGIYVAPMLLLRLFHPPLLLPWPGVQSVDEKRTLFRRFVAVRFVAPDGCDFTLSLPADARADIVAMSGRNDFSTPPVR